MICPDETMPQDPKQHIVWKTLNFIKEKYPDFEVPLVEFRPAW